MESFHGFLSIPVIDTSEEEGLSFVGVEELLKLYDIHWVIISLWCDIDREGGWFERISRDHTVDLRSGKDTDITSWVFKSKRCEDLRSIFHLESFDCFLSGYVIDTSDGEHFAFVEIEEFLKSRDVCWCISPWGDIERENGWGWIC